jgi:Transposase DDE domain group 1
LLMLAIFRTRGVTQMVRRVGLVDKLVVTADGSGQVAHAGSALLVGAADRLGLTQALSDAMALTCERVSAHDRDVVLRDLVVMLAGGGDCLADLGAMRDQADLFGSAASDSTAFGVIDSIDAAGLERLRDAVAVARSQAWKLGARPRQIVLDVDATLTASSSDKEHAAGNFKGGYGHHPLLCYLEHWGGAGGGAASGQRRLEHRRRAHRGVGARATSNSTRRRLRVRSWCAPTVPAQSHELTAFCRDAKDALLGRL